MHQCFLINYFDLNALWFWNGHRIVSWVAAELQAHRKGSGRHFRGFLLLLSLFFQCCDSKQCCCYFKRIHTDAEWKWFEALCGIVKSTFLKISFTSKMKKKKVLPQFQYRIGVYVVCRRFFPSSEVRGRNICQKQTFCKRIAPTLMVVTCRYKNYIYFCSACHRHCLIAQVTLRSAARAFLECPLNGISIRTKFSWKASL